LLSVDLGIQEDRPLTADMPLDEVERVMLFRSLLKKFEGAMTPAADVVSIAKFLQCNKRCADWQFVEDENFARQIDEEVRYLWHQIVYPSFDSSFGLADISAGFNVGPGANVDCEQTDFLTKVFHSSLAGTDPSLHTFYTYAIRGSTWSAAEKKRDDQHGHKIVRGSLLLTVPKDVTETRVINEEPPLNMLFQKGIAHWLEDRLRSVFGIDIRRGKRSTQAEINRRLAQLGSMQTDRLSSFCTTDLKSASDCMALKLCEHVIPPVLTGWLKVARSPETQLPSGDWERLHMVGSMGNAFTFPLQTAMFASIVKACYITMGIPTPRCDSENPAFGVFGDDIIVRREAYEVVNRALARYGFTVNDQKSFSSGSFRESCGGDFWCGNLVRGVYIKSLARETDVYSAINRLIRWCVRSGNGLELTLWYLRARLRRLLVVPFTAGDTDGLKVPESLWFPRYYAIATRSPLYRGLASQGRSYQVPDVEGPWSVEDGHHRNYNGDAILVALIGGYVRVEKRGRSVEGRVGLRENGPPRLKVRWCSVPNWDYVPLAEALHLRGADWVVGATEILIDLVRE
jgi:hypothetical protein